MKQLHFAYFLNVREMIKKSYKNSVKEKWFEKARSSTKLTEKYKRENFTNHAYTATETAVTVLFLRKTKHSPSLNTSIAFKYILICSHEKTL